MNMEDIPIAIPIIIPSISPKSNPEMIVLFDIIVVPSDDVTTVALTGTTTVALMGFIKTSEELIVEFNFSLLSESKISSDEILVNFATRVIGSVVELPPNKVECVKRVKVPV